MRPTAAASVFGALALLASSTAAIERRTPPTRTRDRCAWLETRSIPATRESAGRPVFSATHVLDLGFDLHFAPSAAVSEGEEWELRLVTPTGHLYQSVVFVAPAPRAARVEPAARGRGSWRVVSTPPVPVAGTSIVTSSLYGRWLAEAWRNGTLSCAASFVVRP